MLRAALEQTRRLQENTANCDQLKPELERLQRKQQETGSGKERRLRTPVEPLMTKSRPDSKMEVDEAPRASGRFNLDRVAQEQMSEDLEKWTPPEPTLSSRDLESVRIKPLTVEVALPGLTPSSTGGSQASAGKPRLKELQERLQARTPESPAVEAGSHTWSKLPVRSALVSNFEKNTEGRYHRHR